MPSTVWYQTTTVTCGALASVIVTLAVVVPLLPSVTEAPEIGRDDRRRGEVGRPCRGHTDRTLLSVSVIVPSTVTVLM